MQSVKIIYKIIKIIIWLPFALPYSMYMQFVVFKKPEDFCSKEKVDTLTDEHFVNHPINTILTNAYIFIFWFCIFYLIIY